MVNTDIQLKISLCTYAKCTGIAFSEITGAHSLSNPSGWGGSNPATSESATCEIKIKTPAGLEYIFDYLTSPAIPPAANNGFPTINTNLEYLIPSNELGYVSKLPDGIYYITYTVTNDDGGGDPNIWSESISTYFVVTCAAQSCVDKLVSSIKPDCGCEGKNDLLIKALEADMLLRSIKKGIVCNNIEGVQAILDYIDNFCKLHNPDCNCH